MAPGARRILAAIDARMQEVYWACYSIADGKLTGCPSPHWLRQASWPDLRRSAADLVAGNALQAFPEAIAA